MFLLASVIPYHWMVLAVFFSAALLVIWRTVAYYIDPSSRHSLATMVINVTILCAMTSILLIPVDIFTTANGVQVVQMEALYGLTYLTLAACICILVPFAYFYVEETDAGEEDCIAKSATACKSTFGILVILSLVLGGILVIGERETSHVSTQEAATIWMNALSDDHERSIRMYRALLYIMAACTAFGFINLVFYGGFGLASLPMVLIRGQLGADEEKLELEFSKLKLKKERQALEKRARSSQKARDNLQRLELKLRTAERRMKRLDRQAAGSFYVALYSIIAPFRVGMGLGLMITSMLVVSTVGVVCIDRLFHSACGFECGYLLENDKATMPNLIDMIMVKASGFFPLDYIIFMTIGLYMFLACAHGLSRIGIRLLGIQIFKIKRRKTSSQGLLLSSVMLGITALAVSVTLLSIAPQYVSFGAQVYIPTEGGTKRPCEMGGIVGEEASCRLTNLARFVGTQALNNRLFSLAFFYGQVAFVAMSLVSLLHAFCRRRDGTFQVMSSIEGKRATVIMSGFGVLIVGPTSL